MKPTMKCNTCPEKGDGYWAGRHRIETGHNTFSMEGDDEPPEGSINRSREYQHGLGLYQCLSSGFWAGRARDRLFHLVSDFGECGRPTLLEVNRVNK